MLVDVIIILLFVKLFEYISFIGIYGFIMLVFGKIVLFNLAHRTFDKPFAIIENLHD